MNLTAFYGELVPYIVLIVTLYGVVLVLCGLDLHAGILKAKKRGEFRSSEGYRRTVYKLSRYFNFLLAVTMVDGMQMLSVFYFSDQYKIPFFPFFTSVIAILIGVIEVISIHEKAEDKEKRELEKAAKIGGAILANPSLREVIANVSSFMEENKVNNIHEGQ
jgi:phage-related holin